MQCRFMHKQCHLAGIKFNLLESRVNIKPGERKTGENKEDKIPIAGKKEKIPTSGDIPKRLKRDPELPTNLSDQEPYFQQLR